MIRVRPGRRLPARRETRSDGEPRRARRHQQGRARRPSLLEAVRERAAAGAGQVLRPRPQPRPPRLRSQQPRHSATARRCCAQALPQLAGAGGRRGRGPGRQQPQRLRRHRRRAERGAATARSSSRRSPSHVSHWLHVDLPERVAELGYPMETVPASARGVLGCPNRRG